MKFKSLHLENFRGYKVLDIETFNPSLNLIIGDNGSGKTAILEALTVAMGSFFLGIKDVNSRHILNRDIHINTFDNHQEYAIPVVVNATGEVMKTNIGWTRTLNGRKNRTTSGDAKDIKKIAQEVDSNVREGKAINLPVLAYYATGRLFDEVSDSIEDDNKREQGPIASRFRAYNRCLEAKSTYKQFEKWFRGKELSKIQKGDMDLGLKLIKELVVQTIPNCEDIFYEFDPDEQIGINIRLSDGRVLPFHYLSDGTRNFIAIVADIAYKCVTLNRHLEEDVLIKTEGIILIDELDLHLHPEWQREIINALVSSFPSIQFIASTHSPFIIQEAASNQLIILKDGVIENGRGNNLSIEDIAEDLQLVQNPQWSRTRQKMFEVAKRYYNAVEEGMVTQELKDEFNAAMKPFSLDTGLYAMLEQKRIIDEYKKK